MIRQRMYFEYIRIKSVGMVVTFMDGTYSDGNCQLLSSTGNYSSLECGKRGFAGHKALVSKGRRTKGKGVEA